MNKPELLAPAGSLECLHAAIDNGADAVYIGVGSFNARSRAENFTTDDLGEAILYCHCRGARVYLALNTLLKEEEISEALIIIEKAFNLGIDAIIVQDIGLLSIIREEWPDLPVHASTQMNLFYREAVMNAKSSGISRIVLPRELSLEEIRTRQLAAKESGIEVEVFIHGAHCVSYSGACLFSAMNASGSRSGNRGDCAQPCRNHYLLSSISNRKLRSGHLLSIKDRASVAVLEELINLNVSSLKIEGRMRDAAYVAVTVRAYRLLIDAIIAKRCDSVMMDRVNKTLLQAYNRGGSFSSSYYSESKYSDLYSGEYTSKFGVYSGKIVKMNTRAGYLTISVESNYMPEIGDYLSIRDEDIEIASFPVGKIENENAHINVFGLHPNSIEKLSPGLKIYISRKKAPFALLDEYISKKTEIIFSLRSSEENGNELIVDLRAPNLLEKEICMSNVYILPKEFSGSFLINSRVAEQLSKSKDTPFVVSRVNIADTLKIFAPVSFINAIRRDMIEQLINMIAASDFRKKYKDVEPDKHHSSGKKSKGMRIIGLSDKINQLAIDYIDLRQFEGNLAHNADLYIISIYDLISADSIDKVRMLMVEEPQAKVLIRYPDAYSDKAALVFDEALEKWMDGNPSSVTGIISTKVYGHEEGCIFSPATNLYNSKAVLEACRQEPSGLYLSSELPEDAFASILKSTAESFDGKYLFIHRYGLIEWMQSVYCPVGRNASNCSMCKNESMFRIQMTEDSEGKQNYTQPGLFVICHHDFCTSQIYGPKKNNPGRVSLDVISETNIKTVNTIRILNESDYQIEEILQEFNDGRK